MCWTYASISECCSVTAEAVCRPSKRHGSMWLTGTQVLHQTWVRLLSYLLLWNKSCPKKVSLIMHLALILLTKNAFSTKQANPDVRNSPDTKLRESFVHVINIGFDLPPQDLDIPTEVGEKKVSLRRSTSTRTTCSTITVTIVEWVAHPASWPSGWSCLTHL